MKSLIKIGSRGSKLALYQAELVRTRILNNYPSVQVEVVIIKTSGDMIRRGGFSPLETKRVYTREIEDALIRSDVDIAVHSAKDMAAVLPKGTAMGAVLKREDPRDCLVSRDKLKLAQMPLGSRIGTSSLRRRKQILRYSPELVVEDVRGNVDSRIKKMTEGHFDGLILAYAGIIRLGLTNYVSEVLPIEAFLPAPGQGIIVAQIRAGDTEAEEVLKLLHDRHSAIQLACARAFLRRLEGGCQLPCGMSTVFGQTQIKASGVLFGVDEERCIEAYLEGDLEKPEALGAALAEAILDKGGREILEKIRHHEKNKK